MFDNNTLIILGVIIIVILIVAMIVICKGHNTEKFVRFNDTVQKAEYPEPDYPDIEPDYPEPEPVYPSRCGGKFKFCKCNSYYLQQLGINGTPGASEVTYEM